MVCDKYGFTVNTLTMCPSFTAVYESETDVKKGMTNMCAGAGLCKPADGVAVSDFLSSMGVMTNAFGFCGGLLGKYLRDFLKSRDVGCHFIETSTPTPVKTAVSEDNSVTVFEMRETRTVSIKEILALTKLMRETEPKPEYFVLSGAYPDDLEVGTYCDIIKMLTSSGIKTVTDFSGADMRLSFREKPFIVVMGYEELYDYLFEKVETLAEALSAVKRITKETGATVLCTLGKKGNIYSSPDVMCFAAVKRSKNESIYCRSALIAAFLKAYEFSGENVQYALQYATAYSSAVNGKGDIPNTDDVKKNLSNVDFRTY